jgi:hypothetical protein
MRPFKTILRMGGKYIKKSDGGGWM